MGVDLVTVKFKTNDYFKLFIFNNFISMSEDAY